MKNLRTHVLAFFICIVVTVNAQTTKKIDVAKSKVEWLGKKISGEHNGTIQIKSGALMFKLDKLVGGTFTMDMASIKVNDLEGDLKKILEGHLKSEDFFDVSNYPTALLVFKKVTQKANNITTVTADLTIKGKTNPIIFDVKTNKDTATTILVVNREKYGINYSGNFMNSLGDKVIHEDFDLEVVLKF
ncbi:YceI family protein [Flavobacterium sp.]|jgi:polyisoprenoid-binding protein YceI|uniref:YceI family protein n=1 Tax=Flavobacterium sp. TaxID=239 RepID=UPI004048867D